MKSSENWSVGFREKKTFKDFIILYLYTAQGQGLINPVGQKFYYFNHTL